ncbi:MAG TPA: hypothetical protein VFB69_05280 [Candidatus Dormibacteraeota bacterium]|nr:hypothetical protein [Candidatus Dormibacteraeota bacterium]
MAVEIPDAVAPSLEPTIPPPPPAPPAAPMPPARRGSTRRLLWYAASFVAIVVTLGAFGLLAVDDQSWQRQANDLRQQNDSLHEQLLTAQTTAKDEQGQIADLKAKLQHPFLEIWNVDEKIQGNDYYLAGGVPDTFTYHLNATANGPMNVSIVTFEQFVAGIECVDQGRGNANYCLHHSGTVKSFLNVRSVSYDFHLAEGCAGYMVVFTAPGTVTVHPDVGVTYNPAPTFTGEC